MLYPLSYEGGDDRRTSVLVHKVLTARMNARHHAGSSTKHKQHTHALVAQSVNEGVNAGGFTVDATPQHKQYRLTGASRPASGRRPLREGHVTLAQSFPVPRAERTTVFDE